MLYYAAYDMPTAFRRHAAAASEMMMLSEEDAAFSCHDDALMPLRDAAMSRRAPRHAFLR